jgi:lipoate-protein ligase A
MVQLAEAFWASPAGLLRARLRWDSLRHVPSWLEIGGSVQVQPLDLFARLARGLAGMNRNELATELQKQCVSAHAHLIGFTQDDLLAVLTRAWDRAEQQRDFGLSMEQSNRLTVVNAPGPAANAATLMQQADTLLLPYCARPLECRDKSLDECCDCTGCEVGTACRTAASQSLNIRELKHYAELDGLLENLRAEGSKGVIGMTCQTFFIKHSDAFTRVGLPVLLVDLGGTTCYELQQEAAGYSGHFPHKTTLDTQVLERLVRVRKAG